MTVHDTADASDTSDTSGTSDTSCVEHADLDAAISQLMAGDRRSLVISGYAGGGRTSALGLVKRAARAAGRPIIVFGSTGQYALVQRPESFETDDPSAEVVPLDGSAGICSLVEMTMNWPTAPGPVVLIDDMNDLQCEPARAVRSLLQATSARLAVAVTVRDQLGCTGEVGRLIDDVQSLLAPEFIRLRPWDAAAVAAWSADHLGAPLLPSSAEQITLWCAGRPGWVTATLRTIEERAIRPEGDHLRLVASLSEVAGDLLGLVNHRIGTTGGSRWTVAKLLAVSGGCNRETLIDSASRLGFSEEQTSHSLDELLGESVVVLDDARGLRLVNSIVDTAIDHQISATEHREIRSAVVESISGGLDEFGVSTLVAGTVFADHRLTVQPGEVELALRVAETLLLSDPETALAVAEQTARAGSGQRAQPTLIAARNVTDERSAQPVGSNSSPISARAMARWLRQWRIADAPMPTDELEALSDAWPANSASPANAEVIRELAAIHARNGNLEQAVELADAVRSSSCELADDIALDLAMWACDDEQVSQLSRAAQSRGLPYEQSIRSLELSEYWLSRGIPAIAAWHLRFTRHLGLAGRHAQRWEDLDHLATVMRAGTAAPRVLAVDEVSYPVILAATLLSCRRQGHHPRPHDTDDERWVPMPWRPFVESLDCTWRTEHTRSPLAWWRPTSPTSIPVTIERCLTTGFTEVALHLSMFTQDRGLLDHTLHDKVLDAARDTWANKYLRGTNASEDNATPDDDAFWTLHPFDREIAILVGAGASNADTAQALRISLNAVSNRLKKIYRTLGVHSRVELSRRLPDNAQADPALTG